MRGRAICLLDPSAASTASEKLPLSEVIPLNESALGTSPRTTPAICWMWDSVEAISRMNIGWNAYHPHTPFETLTSFAKPLVRVFPRAIFHAMKCLTLSG